MKMKTKSKFRMNLFKKDNLECQFKKIKINF
jgi:hypothetical protein